MKRFSILYGGTDEDINEILKLVGLSKTGNRKVKEFSLGMKQRLGIAIALLGNPEVMVLDEPINGLDPAGIKEIRDTILNLNKEKNVTFLISSHILDELAKITTTYGIINDGRLEEIDAEELNNSCRKNLRIKVSDVNKAIEILKEKDLLNNYTSDIESITMYDNFDDPALVNELLVKAGIKVFELSTSNSGLEDYFIERIGR